MHKPPIARESEVDYMMAYTVTFMSKKGKVKGKVGCNTSQTVNYLVENWINNPDTKGICIVVNNEFATEEVYTK